MTPRPERCLAPFYPGWAAYNRLLMAAVGPLTPAALAVRAAPTLRPAWLLTSHIIGTRVSWFHGWLGEGPPALQAFRAWEASDATPRRAEDLADGLEITYELIEACLARWTPSMLDESFARERAGATVTHTRQWILWHLLEHDLHHGGELFLTLGMHGIAVPEL